MKSGTNYSWGSAIYNKALLEIAFLAELVAETPMYIYKKQEFHNNPSMEERRVK